MLLHENVDNHTLTYVNQLDAVLLDRVEGNCNVLKGVGLGLRVLDYVYVHTLCILIVSHVFLSHLRTLVVSQLALLQGLHQSHQPEQEECEEGKTDKN